MQFSWTTFLLEAINFLVLVWLLKRLFYAPVKRTIQSRRSAIEETLKKADATQHEAEDLRGRYEGRLREWEQEKQQQWEQLRHELASERQKQMDQIVEFVARERESAEAQAEKNRAERRAEEEKQAVEQAMQFTARLLRDLACPELEAKILDQISGRFPSMLPNRNFSTGKKKVTPQVRSAYPLTELQRNTFIQNFKQLLGPDTTANFAEDPALLAGFEIALGDQVVRANLRDELSYFAESKNDEHS